MNRLALAVLLFVAPALADQAQAAPRPPSATPVLAPAPPVPPVPPAPPSGVVPPIPVPPIPPSAGVAPVPPVPPVPVLALAAPPQPPMPMVRPPKSKGMTFSFSTGQGRLGAQVSSMTPELRVFFGAPEDRGILVQSIRSGTPAADAGLAVGDVLIAVDGENVEDVGDVMEALADRSKGDTIDIVIVRKKKHRTLSATLDDDSAGSGFSSMFQHGFDFDGATPLVIGGDSDVILDKLEAIERRLDALEGKSESRRKTPPSKSAKKRKSKK